MSNVQATPWSFSKIKDFETCPLQYYHKRVLKEFPFVDTPQTIYGNEFHKAVELYINDNKPLEGRFKFAQGIVDKLLDKGDLSIAEIKMGLTADSVSCGFMSDDVWARLIIDLLVVNKQRGLGYIIDWKTGGNAAYADKGQLEVCAMGVFRRYHEVQEIRSGLCFVLINKFPKWNFTRKQLPELWAKWEAKVARLEAAHESDTWNPKPSGLCKKHCPVTTCAHHGQR